MSNYRVARRYALAFLRSAEDKHQLEETTKDVELIRSAVLQNRELRLMLASPIVQKEKKKSIVGELFGRRVGSITLKFLQLVIEKDREKELPNILEQFLKLVDEKRGIVRVEVTAAVEFTEKQKKLLRERLETYTGKTVVPSFRFDRSILGGFVVRLDDRIIDASVVRQLDLLREKLVEKV